MIVPTFFCIGCLVWLGLYEIRKWFELFVNAAENSENDSERDGKEELPDSVKHMYN